MKTAEDFIAYATKTIGELVVEKTQLRKAYNYYNGILDEEAYRHLEDNFGIGNPTSVTFIPLIKKHIDALVGEYLDFPVIPKVTCKDSGTLSSIHREKQLLIASEIFKFYKSKLNSKIMEIFSEDEEGNAPQQNGAPNPKSREAEDAAFRLAIEDIKESLNENFISQYEQAAQDIIEYLLQSRDVYFKAKTRMLLLDLLITGDTYFRAVPSGGENNVEVEVYSPLDVFPEYSLNSPYIKDSKRVVLRRWMFKDEIINRYGDHLSKEDIDSIDEWDHSTDSSLFMLRRTLTGDDYNDWDGILGGVKITPFADGERYTGNLIPVYEVEWISTDKDKRMQRNRVVRIGAEIYVVYGQDDDVVRTMSNPDKCTLSINGVRFLNRNNRPYSMVLACVPLQDKFNILHFYRDNVIANSGTAGSYIDISMIPKYLGVDEASRVAKYLAYKKQGAALLDTTQDGRLAAGQAPLNTIFNGYDETVKAQAIQAIQFAIDSVEQTCSSITGVFRERLNGISQRDAVNNVKMSANNSFIITKPIYQQMDMVIEELLSAALDVAKIVYKNGLVGTILLGEKGQRIFTALPEFYTFTDFDIHIVNTSSVNKELEDIRGLLPTLAQSGQIDLELIVESATTKSVSQLKAMIAKSMRKKKRENDMIGKLQQELQQAQQQMQQLGGELEKAKKELSKYSQEKLNMEQTKMKADIDLHKYNAETERNYKESIIKAKERALEVELMQINDTNPHNDQIKKLFHD